MKMKGGERVPSYIKNNSGKLIALALFLLAIGTMLFSIYSDKGKQDVHIAHIDYPDFVEVPEFEYFPYTDFEEEYEGFQEWIIKWKRGYPRPHSSQFEIVQTDYKRNLLLVHLHDSTDPEQWYEEWMDRSDIEYIRPNQQVDIQQQVSAQADDCEATLEEAQAFSELIKAEAGWEFQQSRMDRDLTEVDSDNTVTVAVLDTGVDLDHPALQTPNILEGFNLISSGTYLKQFDEDNPPTVQDDNGHGTQIIGLMVGMKEEDDFRGLLQGVNILPIKVMDKDGNGMEWDIVQGIYHAIDHGADIINLSLALPYYSVSIEEAISEAEEEGVLVVAATGNRGLPHVEYPAAFPSVLAVGAIDSYGELEYFSNYGSEVNVVAPGSSVSTNRGGGYKIVCGTSVSAPQVTALSALILKKYPDLTPQQVRNHLYYTSQPLASSGWDKYTGFGLIDFEQALNTNPVYDIFSANDSMHRSAPLPIQTKMFSELRDKSDVDYYYIDAEYNGAVTLDILLHIGKQEGIDVTFYPNGDISRAETFTVTKEEAIHIQVPKGKSYVKVKFNDNERRTTPIPYEIVNTFTIYTDNQSPNHALNQAYHVPLNGDSIVGTLPEPDIEDWFYVEVEEEGLLSIYVESRHFQLDLVLGIVLRADDILEINDNSASDFRSYNNRQLESYSFEVEEGRYYFWIGHIDDDYSVNGEYRLNVYFYPRSEMEEKDILQ